MFSKSYLKEPAGQSKDSERLRNRIARGAREFMQDGELRHAFVVEMEQEAGAEVHHGGAAPGFVAEFFREAPMRDVLDGVTCMATVLEGTGRQYWIEFCQRAFAEEGMAYRIDDEGEAHYAVDPAFQETADSVVAVLSRDPFTAAGACVNKAVTEMTQANPDGKHAIRDTFEGVETVFKIVAKASNDLTEKNITALLTPIVDRRFADGDAVAKGAAQRTVEQLKDWTNACHKYRHVHEAEEPIEPPLDLAVVLVGNGLNFARWIASLVN
jgi:hypothetical protein